MKTMILLLTIALTLAACGAGYNPGCEGKEGTTAWCRYHAP